MDKKGWPWKKKVSEKIGFVPDANEHSQLCDPKQSDEQGDSRSLSDVSEEPNVIDSRLEREDSNLKAVNDELQAALSDVTCQDELVQQHMKVAEEAVTGWEKAEVEALALKEKLDVALQQKLATQDRVSHLDGALKECMKQLRHVREEQEQKIHDVVVQKTREWEKIRTDLEANLADVNNQLWDALAENKALSKSLQERSRTITEITDINNRVEAENNMLQVRLGVLEKENARLKYEMHALGKELESRTEEREYNKKTSESAGKQNLESLKKIAKLEEECQRLRLLVRKRPPSPGAMPRVKSEGESLVKESSRKRSPCRGNGSVQLVGAGPDGGLERVLNENKTLSARLQGMEEETKSLKEMLAKRDQDLQAARLMCARTATKLATVEQQLGSLSSKTASTSMDTICQAPCVSTETNLAPESVRAESWASALIAELAQFKKGKENPAPDEIQDHLNMDLMDDFVEMEKLASVAPIDDAVELDRFKKSAGMPMDVVTKHVDDLEGVAHPSEQDFKSIDRLCSELKDKLAYSEDQLKTMQSKQSENEATILKLQHLLAAKSETTTHAKMLRSVLEAGKTVTETEKTAEVKHPVDSAAAYDKRCLEPLGENSNVWLPSCISDDISQPSAVVSVGAELDLSTIGLELAAAVRKVMDIVEVIAQSDYTFVYPDYMLRPDAGFTEASGENHAHGNLGKQWRNTGLDACVESLVNLCNSFVKGKLDAIDFIAEMASAMEWLVGLIFSVPDKSPSRMCVQRHIQCCKGSPATSDSEVTSTGISPTRVLDNVRDLKNTKAAKSIDAIRDQSSLSDISSQFSELTTQDEELTKIRSEKADLKRKLEGEFKRGDKLEHEILRLKLENGRLEHDYRLTVEKVEDLAKQIHEANRKLQDVNTELLETECHSSDLRSKLHETVETKLSLENTIAKLQSVKQSLESQLLSAKENGKMLEQKVLALEEELKEEMRNRRHIEIQFRELKQEQDQLQGSSTVELDLGNSALSADEEVARLKKEQEIAAAAEKLAECQETILVLGKQLKALGAPKEAVNFSTTSEISMGYRITPITNRLRSSSDQVHSHSDLGDEVLYCSNDDQRASPVSRWSETEKEEKQEQRISSSRTNSVSNSMEAESGLVLRRGHPSGRFGRQQQPELQRGNTFPSPNHAHNQEGPSLASGCTMEAGVSSPLRSPARFLSLRNRNLTTPHGDSDPAEKHGSGFSRFFVRTRSGH